MTWSKRLSPNAPVDNASHHSIYESSSQFLHWRFSPEQLTAIRESLNRAAVNVIRDAIEGDEPGSSQSILFLTASEEHALVKHYITKVSQLCAHFRFSEEVEATAITYLKRFYLKNTVMDWHPKNVMLTALFLALKTTNNAISLDDYTANIPKTVPSDVLDLEFLVAQSLGFEFAVWHAHRAVWGLQLDLQTLPGLDPSLDLDNIFSDVITQVRSSRLTDAELIYTPSQIALACLASSSSAAAQSWAHSKGVSSIFDSVIPSIQDLIAQSGIPPEVGVVKGIDKRLRICKNPEKVKGSKAWERREKEREERARIKREKKAEETRKAMEADPFGGELVDGNVISGGMPLDDDDDD
ncbi:cyclin-like protein [Hysterangium stoloniferum]|nr:cyclin-like protein [Hysterangium stoloniferum]